MIAVAMTIETIEHTMETHRRTTTMKDHHQEIPAMTTMTEETQATVKNQLQRQGDIMTLMMMTSAASKIPGPLLITAFQLIRPSRISNLVMSSAMTRLSKIDTARLKITESSNSVMLGPDQTKEQIP
jgi:hypothetical protein